MSRINRYVLKEILGPTLLGLLVYGVVLIMNLMLEAAELFIRRDLPAVMVGQYLVYSLPRIMVLVIPMAVLLGVLVGISRLSSDSEITALRSLGYSDRRLLVPVLTLGLVASLVSGVLFNYAVPGSNYAQHQLNARIFLASDINREIQPRVFYERIPNLLIYADAASPEDGTLDRVLIYQKSPTGQEEISSAGHVSMQQKQAQGSIEFHLDQVTSHSWQSTIPDNYQISRSRGQIIDRPPDLFVKEMIRSLTSPPPRNLREQNIRELSTTLSNLQGRPESESLTRQISETRVELHKKFSLPATSLIYALLGLPLALGHRRSGSRTWGFVVSLLVIIISYALLTTGEDLADRDKISPWLAMWGGNILFLTIGLGILATGSRIDITGVLPRRLFRRRKKGTPVERSVAEHEAELDLPEPELRQRRFPSTIERYLLRHLALYSGFVAVSMLVLFSLFYTVNLVDDLTRGSKPLTILFPYLMYIQPQILFAYVLPISLCIGTLVTFASLARTHELTAIRAGGIGLFRVASPFLAASLVAAGLSFLAHDGLLPYTNQKANQIRDQIRGRSPRSYRHPAKRWVFGSQGLLFYYSDFNPGRGEFQDLAVIRFHPSTFDIAEHTFSERAVWDKDVWSLQEGWTRRFTSQGEVYEPFDLQKHTGIDPPEYFDQNFKAPDQMNFRELRGYVGDLEQRGYDTRELRVGLHRKLAIPSVAIVMVLIGLPFAVRVEHRGPMFAIAVSILLVFVYFGVLQVFGKLGEVAMLPPFIAGWAPNILFGGTGIYLASMARW